MARLPKYTLAHDDKRDVWKLSKNGADRATATFDTKAEAIKGGVLKQELGTAGGSVSIQKLNGKFQEERTYPRSADPKKSPG